MAVHKKGRSAPSPTISKEGPTKIPTFEFFSHEDYKEEFRLMSEFRKSCYGEKMEETWKSLRAMYLPRSPGQVTAFAQYTVDEATQTASPDVLFSDDEELEDFNEPLVAVKIHTALSLLTQRTPDVRWDSDEGGRFEQNAILINALRHEDWQDEQVKQQYVMLWFYNILFGTTFFRRYYEKLERTVNLPSAIDLAEDKVTYEEANIVDFDATTAKALSPLQVWIDPGTRPMAPRSMRKVIYEEVYSYDRFIDRFQDVISKKVLDTIKPSPIEGYQGDNLVRCRFFEHMDLDMLYIEANDQELDKSHLPQNHKQLSVMMSIWMPRGESNPYGLGPIEMMTEDKRALDKFKSMTLTQVKFSIYKAVFYTGNLQTDGGEQSGLKLRPDRMYKVSEKPTFLDITGPGRDSWDAMQMLRERIDDASGINRPLGGEIVKTTAFQTDLAKDAALARLSVPIANVALLLTRDAELTLELQRQHYSLPHVEELLDPQDIEEANRELEAAKASGKPVNFNLWVDIETLDEEGNISPKVFKGTYREAQLNVEKSTSGAYLPSKKKHKVAITSDYMDWKGKIYVITDSMLSIAPTIEKSRKLEMYNLLIPMFSQPPELVAKPAAAIVKIYGEDPDDVLPQHFLAFLAQPEQPAAPLSPLGAPNPSAPGQPPVVSPSGALASQQPGAPVVSTGMNSEKDLVQSATEQAGPA